MEKIMNFTSPQRRSGGAGFFTPDAAGSARSHLKEPNLSATKKRLLDVLPKENDEVGENVIIDGKRRRSIMGKVDKAALSSSVALEVAKNQEISDAGGVENDKVVDACHRAVTEKVENSLCLEIVAINGIRQGYNNLNGDWMISDLLAHLIPEDRHHSLELHDQKNQAIARDKLVSNLDQSITYRIKVAK